MGIFRRVGMWNTQRGSGYFFCRGETHEAGNVFAEEGAKQQVWSPQFLRSGHKAGMHRR